MARSANRPRSIRYFSPSNSRTSLPSAIRVPTPVLVKKAGMPAPPARMRSASVPCGLNSSSSSPASWSWKQLVLADIGRDHLLDLPRLQQAGEPDAVDAGIVGDHREALHPGLAERVRQGLGNAAEAEAAGHDHHAVLEKAIEGRFRVGVNLFHER